MEKAEKTLLRVESLWKPIYSRHGDEHKLAGFSATLQAIISFVENGGDRIKFVRAGKHQVVFLVEGPIYLVCICCTEKPYEALRGQLELIYGQILLILTKSVNRCFEKNPKVDMAPLLGGTAAVFSSLIHAFSWVKIEKVLAESNVLREARRSVMDGGLHVEDLPVDSSIRSGFSSPHLGVDKNTPGSVSHAHIGGPTGLWHFIYQSIYLDQYVSSEFSSPINSTKQQKRLYRAYQKLYASMHEPGAAPHKTQFRRDEDYVLLCWVTQDFELYAAFDPLADKASAIKTCNRVCQWVRDLENEIFLLGASPFSW